MHMPETEATFETIHKIAPATRHFTLLVAENGNLLDYDSNEGFFLTDQADDRVIWEQFNATTFDHVDSQVEVSVIRAAGNSEFVSLVSDVAGWTNFAHKSSGFRV